MVHVSEWKRKPCAVREGSDFHKHFKSPFSLHTSFVPCLHVENPPRGSRTDATRLVLNQQLSPCAHIAPLTCTFWNDLRSLQTQPSVAVRVWWVSETLMPIYNSSCSSFLVPKLAIKWFNWPWNVDCKLWLEKTRDSRVIFPSNLALTCQPFYS